MPSNRWRWTSFFLFCTFVMYLCTDTLTSKICFFVWSAHILASPLRFSPGEQYSGITSAGSLHPRAGSSYSRASGSANSGAGGIPQQEGGGPVCPGLGEARSAGACRPDDLHSGAAQGDRRALLCAGCKNHSQQVAHVFSWNLNSVRI